MSNQESQEMELLALKNIYEEKYFTVDEEEPPSGRFIAHVRLPRPFEVKCKNVSESDVFVEELIQVEHLPPIILSFQFPNTYPQNTCPAFLLSCSWISLQELTKLCRKLESLWSDCQDSILYTWFTFLEDEVLDFLNITDSLDVSELLTFKMIDNFSDRDINSNICNDKDAAHSGISDRVTNYALTVYMQLIKPSVIGGSEKIDTRAFTELTDGKYLMQILKDYNEFKIADTFNCSNQTCDICFSTKKGSDFLTFPTCRHYFCRECIKSYFETQIIEGNVISLNCLESKCTVQADGSFVKDIVSAELYEKYDRLLLSRTLESMSDITLCPRKPCQCPVLLETCGTMGTCPACNFVFCALCKMVYHGVAPCSLKWEEREALVEQYETGDINHKQELERKYGKRNIKMLVENTLSEKWKKSNSKNCPSCNTSIQKTQGCHKMTCSRCGIYFCWLCMSKLPAINPYHHFSDRNLDCYNRLFPEEERNEFDDDDFFEPGEFLNGYNILY